MNSLIKLKNEDTCEQTAKSETDDNPLQILINRMIEKNMHMEMLNNLDDKLLKRILDMTIDFDERNTNNVCFTFNFKVYAECLILLLKRWDGWRLYNMNDFSSVKTYNALYSYLYNNISLARDHKSITLLLELDKYSSTVGSCVAVSCSFKKLKTLFYENPRIHTGYFHDNCSSHHHHPGSTFPFNILNWPFISINLTLPNFSISRQCLNSDEFYLIKITDEYKFKFNKQNDSELLKMNSTGFASETYPKYLVKNYFNQLKNAIDNRENYISFDRKTELKKVINEFEKDIDFICYRNMKTNIKYSVNLTVHPYVRYFGYSDNADMAISIPEQKLVDPSMLNVRLQQVTRPKVSFTLEEFQAVHKSKNENVCFVFDESFFDNVRTCILYKCILCDEELGSYSFSPRVSEHFMMFHGMEPDWECGRCAKVFSTNYLSEHRWSHNCN